MKTKHPSIFIDKSLYGLDKYEISNQPKNYIYSNCNSDLIKLISNFMPQTILHIENSIEHSLLF